MDGKKICDRKNAIKKSSKSFKCAWCFNDRPMEGSAETPEGQICNVCLKFIIKERGLFK